MGVGLFSLGSDVGLIITSTAGIMIKYYRQKNISRQVAMILAILVASFGVTLGINLTFNTSNSLLSLLILGTCFSLFLMLVNPYWQYQQKINRYRKQEYKLIKL